MILLLSQPRLSDSVRLSGRFPLLAALNCISCFRRDHLMAIGNAVQRGAFIFIYDEKGFKTGTAPAGTGGEDGLKGYTSSTVNVRRGAFVYSHDEKGRQISATSAR